MTPNARGGLLFVLEENGPEVHEDDLTPAERVTAGLPALPAPPTPGAPPITEEVGPDV